jgi:kinetochore protein Mis13/DSN1
MNNGTLSDWFSRDDAAPRPVPLRKKANPRNIANAAKAEELERQLERYIQTTSEPYHLVEHVLTNINRLKKERAEWDELIQSAASVSLAATAAEEKETAVDSGTVSPIHPDLLDSPQRAIYDRFHAGPGHPPTDPAAVQHRLRHISDDLEFTLDQFAHGVHVLSTTRETADRVADRSLALAAVALQDRHQQRAAAGGSAVEQMDALRGLARVLNTQRK